MAFPSSSVQAIIKEKKYPFILFSATLLLIVVTIFFSFSSSAGSSSLFPRPLLFSSTDLRPSSSSPEASSSSPPPPPSVSPSQDSIQTTQEDYATSAANTSSSSPAPSDIHHDQDTAVSEASRFKWSLCKGPSAVDYIPCLDNLNAIQALKSRKHMEHRERHCPTPNQHCLPPMPTGYKVRIPWPKSRDMIWYSNVPHSKLVEYKKDQNWVKKDGEYLIFPGGGTQFKHGVSKYIELIEQTLPEVQWGSHVRVTLDIGCGVASFGGALLNRNVLTMSFAPKDEHEAQIQFALERGIPATLAVIGTRRLTYPDNAFDMLHCARCRIRWDADGGKSLLELNRILRPGGYFIWSATPVYRKDNIHRSIWNATTALAKTFCWEIVGRAGGTSWFGLVIFKKTTSTSCLKGENTGTPPLCQYQARPNSSWYEPLGGCISNLPVDASWPDPWPVRLHKLPRGLSAESDAGKSFEEDTKSWSALMSDVYSEGVRINWTSLRNVMDMNAGYGGFAAALVDMPIWVMNVVPIDMKDTLKLIYDRGLIGVYHDWCEPFDTYPRTFDLLHASFLFKNVTQRCDMVDVVAEIDRIVRPGGYLLVQETGEMIERLRPILISLYWRVSFHQEQFLVGLKGFWRPEA